MQLGIYSSAGLLVILSALALLIYSLAQWLLFKKLSKAERIIIAAAYSLLIISALFLRQTESLFSINIFDHSWYRIGLNPLSFIHESLNDTSTLLVSVLNVLLFIPLQPILAINNIRAPWWLVVIGFIAIELLQFAISAGFFDMGDIVLYTVGYLIGVGIWRLLKWKK